MYTNKQCYLSSVRVGTEISITKLTDDIVFWSSACFTAEFHFSVEKQNVETLK